VLPQRDGEMLTTILGKDPGSYPEQAVVTLCALRDDVTTSETPTGTLQQLVPQSSDPFLGLLGNEDASQHHTSPDQTEDEEPQGEKSVMKFSKIIETFTCANLLTVFPSSPLKTHVFLFPLTTIKCLLK
jgi:hypothetical protein